MVDSQTILVEVAYALPDRQAIVPVKVVPGTTVYQAAVESGVTGQFPQIDLETARMGIWGKAVKDPKTQALNAGERVEIYRPLLIDPKVSRANRAEKAKRAKGAEED
jgi:putative ubiquitin-RnfH superfamily antitoxin RatB of RatAB toxin-antitoxin module